MNGPVITNQNIWKFLRPIGPGEEREKLTTEDKLWLVSYLVYDGSYEEAAAIAAVLIQEAETSGKPTPFEAGRGTQ